MQINQQIPDILKEICDYKLRHIEQRKNILPLAEVKERIKSAGPLRGFLNIINEKLSKGEPALIAEIKKASPSKGLIRADFDPASLALEYKKGGATCLSVLTDEKYFQGADDYLSKVKKAVELPVLRKDFMLDPYQVYEARMLGADCILLIIAALSLARAKELEAIAFDLGMDVLVETHNSEEIAAALKLKSKLIGINNRNLKTLKVDINTTGELFKEIQQGYTVVCESGISSHEEVKKITAMGVKTFLVGESLMKQDDVAAATNRLLTGA